MTISSDLEINRLWSYVLNLAKKLSNSIIIDGVIQRDLVIASGSDVKVNHGLDREPIGWFIVSKNANSNLYESSTSNSFRNRYLLLRSSATVTVSIWFF